MNWNGTAAGIRNRGTTMRFRTFEWPQEPASLEITHRRQVRETVLAGKDSVAEDAGALRCVIKGTGQFTGADAMAQFAALQAAVDEGGAGVLCLPGMRPFRAVARQLTLAGKAHPNAVGYTFEFVEAEEAAQLAAPAGVAAREGETLWDIAFRFSRDIESMIAANPQIAKIRQLTPGEWVVIP